ncbi:hypothetical protein WAI453_011557 [Rhynchosporium graminicola]
MAQIKCIFLTLRKQFIVAHRKGCTSSTAHTTHYIFCSDTYTFKRIELSEVNICTNAKLIMEVLLTCQ